jgi:hypothetical protein
MQTITEEIITHKTTFKSIDGKIFDNENSCVIHELELKLFNEDYKCEIDKYFLAIINNSSKLQIVKYIGSGMFSTCFYAERYYFDNIAELYTISKSDKILG